MRTVVLVQSRTGSSRLPGKALRVLHGKPMFWHVVTRAAEMGYPTWVATSDLGQDDLLAEAAKDAGWPVFRGSERDVLHRMRSAAYVAGADVVVRVTGDCPCFAPDVGERVVQRYRAELQGIVTNDTSVSGWPDGLDCEVFGYEMLAAADETVPVPKAGGDARAETREWLDREHVTPWMRRTFQHHVVGCGEDWRHVKLSVDSLEDFARVKVVMGQARGHEWPSLREVLARNYPAGEGL